MTDEAFDAESLPVPELDDAFAARVLRLARGELAPGPQSAGLPIGLALRGAVVPLLLLSAAGCRTGLTVKAVASVYGEPVKR